MATVGIVLLTLGAVALILSILGYIAYIIADGFSH